MGGMPPLARTSKANTKLRKTTSRKQSKDGPGQRDPDRTRAVVLSAARQEFAKLGLAGSRVDEIVRIAGVSKQVVYYHFSGKDELFRAALLSSYEEIVWHTAKLTSLVRAQNLRITNRSWASSTGLPLKGNINRRPALVDQSKPNSSVLEQVARPHWRDGLPGTMPSENFVQWSSFANFFVSPRACHLWRYGAKLPVVDHSASPDKLREFFTNRLKVFVLIICRCHQLLPKK